MMPIVMRLDMLLTVGGSVYLYRKLKKTNDLFNTSKEIVSVGWFSIAAMGKLATRVGIVGRHEV